MHKKPFSKQRYIAASSFCSTKPLSQVLTKCLKLIESQHRTLCHRYEIQHGINPMWIIQNSTDVYKRIFELNHKQKCKDIKTYDFSTLYTSIPHKDLKKQLSWVIKEAFKSSKRTYISVYKNDARWTDSPKQNTMHLDSKKLIRLMNWLINNIFVTFGNKCFRQKIGIPMGTDCAPFLANLFLYSYEFKWIDKQRKRKHYLLLKKFRHCSRYIDDLLLVNNSNFMLKIMDEMYPKQLELIPDENDGTSAPFLDLKLTIQNNVIITKIFDKRDAFDFPIVNFPNLKGNIPIKNSYGVFIGEMVRYARACTFLTDFRDRTHVLVKKLKSQWFHSKLLKRAWLKFCDSHILLIQKYDIEVLNLYKEW